MMIASLMLTAGWWYYRTEVDALRRQRFNEISAIGTLKVGQIQKWRQERRDDANQRVGNPFLRKGAMEYLRGPSGPVRAELLELLRYHVAAGTYANALLFAPDGSRLLSAQDSAEAVDPATKRAISAALDTKSAALSDLFRDIDGHVKLDTVGVVRDTDGAPVVALILRADAADYLYPLIQSWPTPSQTSETFIARRDGDSVVFLNEARLQSNTALRLREPISRTDIPAVQAALGRRGVFEGTDYRGVAVLADLQPIPESDWYMVAKVDEKEAFAEGRTRTGLIIIVVASLISLGAVGTASIYRQQSAARVSLLNAYNRSLIEANLDPLVVIGTDGKITDANTATESATGLPRTKLIGTDFLEYFTDPDHARSGYQRAFRDGIVRDFPLELRRRDGHVTSVLYNASIFHDEHGKVAGVFAAARDITERKRAEEEIKRLNSSLEQRVATRTAELTAANQELEGFSYAVSHDLRAPLRAMTGFSQALVEDHGPSLNSEARDYLRQICLASQRMGELVEGLLTLSRCTRGELRREKVDISSMCEIVQRELTQADPVRRVEWHIQPGLAAWGDPRLLEVVLNNLLSNAWKYTSRQPVPVIRVWAETQDGKQQYCVADNGAGFDMKHAGNLFAPFQRLHRQDEFPGIGVGLATVQRILHRHGGSIRATAAVDQGATFIITLPAFEKDNQKTP